MTVFDFVIWSVPFVLVTYGVGVIYDAAVRPIPKLLMVVEQVNWLTVARIVLAMVAVEEAIAELIGWQLSFKLLILGMTVWWLARTAWRKEAPEPPREFRSEYPVATEKLLEAMTEAAQPRGLKLKYAGGKYTLEPPVEGFHVVIKPGPRGRKPSTTVVYKGREHLELYEYLDNALRSRYFLMTEEPANPKLAQVLTGMSYIGGGLVMLTLLLLATGRI